VVVNTIRRQGPRAKPTGRSRDGCGRRDAKGSPAAPGPCRTATFGDLAVGRASKDDLDAVSGLEGKWPPTVIHRNSFFQDGRVLTSFEGAPIDDESVSAFAVFLGDGGELKDETPSCSLEDHLRGGRMAGVAHGIDCHAVLARLRG